jgi:CRISPR system Cascade subunit CasA
VTFTFDLVDQPWLPCRRGPRQALEEVSLSEALMRAHDFQELMGDNPLVTVAAHRLLLAILHRCFGPADAKAWGALWRGGRFPAEPIQKYLDAWRHRFDLFHPERPFYQAPLGFDRARSIACLMFQADNNPTLFDHTTTDAPPALRPAEAARHILAYQAFDFGGIKSAENGKESAKAAPLNQCATVLVRGANLFQSLMLNLHRYAPEHGAPFRFDGTKDAPAWEQADVTRSVDRYPLGYLDILTYQSRRLLLKPELSETGELVVLSTVLMKGYQVPEGHKWQGKETMVPFRRNLKAKSADDPWPPVKFMEGRLFFRDSLALVQSASGDVAPPMVMDWLRELMAGGHLEEAQVLPVDVLGFTVDRAKPLFWKHERFPLPLVLLNSEVLVEGLKEMLEASETGGKAVRRAVYFAAELLLAPTADQDNGRQPDRSEVGRLADSMSPEASYWSLLEPEFHRHVLDLSRSKDDEIDSLLDRWFLQVEGAARRSFDEGLRSLDVSGRSLKAAARGRQTLERALRSLQKTEV